MLFKKQNGVLTILLIFIYSLGFSQSNNQGSFSGSLESNGNFFQEDSLIEAFNTPQYDHQLFGSEVWLDLKYSNYGFDVGMRLDFFNNSNLRQPNESYTDQGLGRWYVNKKVNKLGITAGYIYDQIGSGIIFRAYEQRPLLIDNALVGLKLTYDLTPEWKVKVLTGRQKNLFDLYESVIKGASIDGYVKIDSSSVSFAPGFSESSTAMLIRSEPLSCKVFLVVSPRNCRGSTPIPISYFISLLRQRVQIGLYFKAVWNEGLKQLQGSQILTNTTGFLVSQVLIKHQYIVIFFEQGDSNRVLF